MVQFLVLALWLLAAAGAMRDQWESYDNLVIMLVQATKASNAHGSKGATASSAEDASTDMASGFELCETLYEHAVAAAPRTFCAHLAGLLCLSPAAWALPQAKERCVFQRIRQRFMWKANPASPLPNDYDFSDYLLECIRTFLAHTMHIPISIWVKSIFVMMGVFFAMGLNEERRIFWQALVGWLMYAQGALMCATQLGGSEPSCKLACRSHLLCSRASVLASHARTQVRTLRLGSSAADTGAIHRRREGGAGQVPKGANALVGAAWLAAAAAAVDATVAERLLRPQVHQHRAWRLRDAALVSPPSLTALVSAPPPPL